jgi:hypothetical protein
MKNSYDISERGTDDHLVVDRKSFISALIKHMHYRQMYNSRVSCDKTNMMLCSRDDQRIGFSTIL